MKSINKAGGRKVWCWRRWISSGQEDVWVERLQDAGCLTWTFTEKPNRKRLLLAVYQEDRAGAASLSKSFGGQMRAVADSEWMGAGPIAPTRIGRKLEIVHEKTSAAKLPGLPRLYIPHGLAFGSGDHSTTFMLLRALACRENWKGVTFLDLGTGSGVLALAARLFGARKILATDFDAEAIRTARQNEALNFSSPLVKWQCADVKRLNGRTRYGLVLANLFSGILCEAAPQIAASVAPGGELWLSGVLRSQQREVVTAYRRQGMKPVRAVSRGKWVMLQFLANA